MPRPPPAPAHPARLFDERGGPSFREVFGGLLTEATRVDVAVTRIRLTTLDLSERELAGLERMRVLVAHLRADVLDAEAHAVRHGAGDPAGLARLLGLLERGVIEMRAAPLAGWSPDFTVFSDARGAQAVLMGFHWFQRPFPFRGPALAGVHYGQAARRARARFEQVWSRAHEVGPAVGALLGPSLIDTPPGSR